ncbi:unnamed protein product [Closterium sp. NIES-64]|nr:unnamed protein product [Closterium sp. NIES-64]
MASIVVITTQDDAAHAFPESAIDDRLLIPGLPNEIAIRCLARVPYMRRLRLGLVCKSWRDAFRGGTIYNIRQREKILEELLCVSFLDKAHGRLVLKILDEGSRKWAPLSTEYRHTKCKVRSFHCRAFRHKVFVFTRDEWALVKDSNLAMLGVTRAGAGVGGDRNMIHEYNLESKQWEPAVPLPSRHRWAGSFRQCYFLVSLDGKLCVIDTWQEKWLWVTGKVKANASFLEFSEATAEERVGGGFLGGSRAVVGATDSGRRRIARCQSASSLRYSWSRVHMPVETDGRELAGYAVFQV